MKFNCVSIIALTLVLTTSQICYAVEDDGRFMFYPLVVTAGATASCMVVVLNAVLVNALVSEEEKTVLVAKEANMCRDDEATKDVRMNNNIMSYGAASIGFSIISVAALLGSHFLVLHELAQLRRLPNMLLLPTAPHTLFLARAHGA